MTETDEELPKCQYKYESDSPTRISFACLEPSIANSNSCIFHDADHYAEHEQKAVERFKQIVKESIENDKPLECFGYYLPTISFAELVEGESFAHPAYFNEATFYKVTDFSEAKFSKEVSFSKAQFFGEAYFKEASFYGQADFSEASFSKRVDFWDVLFSEVNFSKSVFSDEAFFHEVSFQNSGDFSGATFSKEANFNEAGFNFAGFSEAWFSGQAIFSEAAFKAASFDFAAFSKKTNFADARFSEEAEFVEAEFTEQANFYGTEFKKGANFTGAKFLNEAHFAKTRFEAKTLFNNTLFEQQNKVVFYDTNLSNVSFADCDIIRIRYAGGIDWGGNDRATIIEEEWLRRKVIVKNGVGYFRGVEEQEVNLELVLSVYRNLRENYEFRLRYDEAGKFFIKEMELKRKYRNVSSTYELKLISLHKKLRRDKRPLPEIGDLIENSWFTRHFSLTGLYYHLSRYGQSISRPALIGVITVFLSTLFWLTQSNVTLEPHFDPSLETASTSTFIGFREIVNSTQWLKGFERSLADFLPLLSLGGKTEVGIVDYIIKIVGGSLTFVLLAIALRRKFERKYTR